uniref:CSON009945 protein n=1 Tax=Culicoides sonorensis TaxID=179676 RepID=A0A336LJV5_CULSO
MEKESYNLFGVRKILLEYLSGITPINDISKKAYLKVLIKEFLNLDTTGVTSENRTNLYNFIVRKIFEFKVGNPGQTELSTIQQYLKTNVRIKIDEYLNHKICNEVKIKEEKPDENAEKNENGSKPCETHSKSGAEIDKIERQEKNHMNLKSSKSSVSESRPKAIGNRRRSTRKQTITEKSDNEIESRKIRLKIPLTYFENVKQSKNQESRNERLNLIDVSKIQDLYTSKNFQPKVLLNKEACEALLQELKLIETEKNHQEEIKEEENPDLMNNESKQDEPPPVNQMKVTALDQRGAQNDLTSCEVLEPVGLVIKNELEDNVSIEVPSPMMVSIPKERFTESETISQSESTNSKSKSKTKSKTKKKSFSKNDKSKLHCNVKKCIESKEQALHINTTPSNLCNFSFQLNPITCDLSMKSHINSQNQNNVIDCNYLTMNQILYWPGVGFKLNLPELEIVRYCNLNQREELITESFEFSLNDIRKNDNELYRFYENETIQHTNPVNKEIELSHSMVITYLMLILKSLDDFLFERESEIKLVIETILEDLKRLDRIHLKTSYSYFCGETKYYKRYKFDDIAVEHNKSLTLQKIYNPEIIFKITRCSFEEQKDFNASSIFAKNEFLLMLKKGFSLFCVNCQSEPNGQFTGPIKKTLLLEHIGKISLKLVIHGNISA